MLVPQPLLDGPSRIRRHPYEHHIRRVPRQPTRRTRQRRRNGHLYAADALTGSFTRSESLLEVVVNAETGDGVGHLAEDGGGEAGVQTAAET